MTKFELGGIEFRIYYLLFLSFIISEHKPVLSFLMSWKDWSIVFHWPWHSGEQVFAGYKCWIIRDFKTDDINKGKNESN